MPPLPADCAWFPDFQATGKLCLSIGGIYGTEVALILQRIDAGGWCTTTNRHKDWERRGRSVLASKALAVRMANRWAAAKAESLRAEVARKSVGKVSKSA